MLKEESLRKGLIIWWTRSSPDYGGEWDCPCIITHVDKVENKYRMFSFDDFKETKDLELVRPNGSDDSCLREMRLSSMEELKAFLGKEKASVGKKVAEARQALTAIESRFALYDKDPLQIMKERIKKGKGEVVDF